ncbi:hypothetical protein KIPB_004684 [Kipferlia bialata]|uniref:Uncharacterized protein n=1 Tax=Kipferlia bialata TaxID=797122 RepID=A0A9K3CVW4_9EUKA|nr:hypothetical protein KIPB_004684 [Kipferlia bialata]|eukprot:g4684.t1
MSSNISSCTHMSTVSLSDIPKPCNMAVLSSARAQIASGLREFKALLSCVYTGRPSGSLCVVRPGQPGGRKREDKSVLHFSGSPSASLALPFVPPPPVAPPVVTPCSVQGLSMCLSKGDLTLQADRPHVYGPAIPNGGQSVYVPSLACTVVACSFASGDTRVWAIPDTASHAPSAPSAGLPPSAPTPLSTQDMLVTVADQGQGCLLSLEPRWEGDGEPLDREGGIALHPVPDSDRVTALTMEGAFPVGVAAKQERRHRHEEEKVLDIEDSESGSAGEYPQQGTGDVAMGGDGGEATEVDPSDPCVWVGIGTLHGYLMVYPLSYSYVSEMLERVAGPSPPAPLPFPLPCYADSMSAGPISSLSLLAPDTHPDTPTPCSVPRIGFVTNIMVGRVDHPQVLGFSSIGQRPTQALVVGDHFIVGMDAGSVMASTLAGGEEFRQCMPDAPVPVVPVGMDRASIALEGVPEDNALPPPPPVASEPEAEEDDVAMEGGASGFRNAQMTEWLTGTGQGVASMCSVPDGRGGNLTCIGGTQGCVYVMAYSDEEDKWSASSDRQRNPIKLSRGVRSLAVRSNLDTTGQEVGVTLDLYPTAGYMLTSAREGKDKPKRGEAALERVSERHGVRCMVCVDDRAGRRVAGLARDTYVLIGLQSGLIMARRVSL